MNVKYILYIALSLAIFLNACRPDDDDEDLIITDPPIEDTLTIDWSLYTHDTTPYELSIPSTLPPNIIIPPDNPLTVKGVALGRKLFYDPILSADSTQSCASCHLSSFGFTDAAKQFSVGIDGIAGKRNSMPIMNLGFINGQRLFWDGRSSSLEDQAILPIIDPVEMHNTWEKATQDLNNVRNYRIDFYEAFGITEITRDEVVKAIAQFERTLISGTSKYDLAVTPGSGVFFNDLELEGYNLFYNEEGDCFHCHGDPALFTDNLFRNNGLSEVGSVEDFADKGLGEVTGNSFDNGLFRTPSLRNIALTAPYMHDGRFATLDEVLDHYSHGIKSSPNLDIILITDFNSEGKFFTPEQRESLLAFLHTLTDTTFINNPAHQNPFE